jgi:Arf-GAP/GTPase/ANK repeat/PH domain-containing protein 1/3
MDDSHGKEIDLQKTTIKIPGANKPRIGKSVINLDTNKLQNDINSLHLTNNSQDTNLKNGTSSENDALNQQPIITNAEILSRVDVNSKKRHRRIKSNHKSDQNKEEEQEGFEFIIVSLDNKQWHFEAASNDEREEWVQAIEQQILSSLQTNETNKLKAKHGAFTADSVAILTVKCVAGNSHCADCDALSMFHIIESK